MYNQKDIVKWSQSLTLSGETTPTPSPAEAILVDTAGLVEVKYGVVATSGGFCFVVV